MDYKALLIKYMKLVMDQDYWSFLDNVIDGELSEVELDELKRIETYIGVMLSEEAEGACNGLRERD